eukprot:Rhum_TRINITY_DN14822_c9_g1::Rhum_TRINITY_DN14822_c9_g1_i1::g.121807::m.121807/K03680/EIF2B4; translation initiation factor eIF-2B subunit delta
MSGEENAAPAPAPVVEAEARPQTEGGEKVKKEKKEKPQQQQQQGQGQGQGQEGEKPAKSKAELRRERAAKQEAERAAKAWLKEKQELEKASGKAPTETKKKPEKKEKPGKDKDASKAGGEEKKAALKKKAKKKDDVSTIHPAVLRLGELYANMDIVGGNARAIALLQSLKELLGDYVLSKDGVRFQEDFTARLTKHIAYLNDKRVASFSMTNMVSTLESSVAALPDRVTVEEAKQTLTSVITDHINEILQADRNIAEMCVGEAKTRRHQIKDGDVILTYAKSSAVEWVLRLAHSRGVKFEVVCVDSRPLHEGRKLSTCLSALGIPTTYCLLNSLSSVLSKCNKVFVGASTMLTNGSLVSRAGTAMVCMMAKHFTLPVLCFCETYKFADKVWLGSLTHNEEAPPGDLLKLMNGKESPLSSTEKGSLKVVSYLYDLTPAEHLDMVVTELGPMHPTSVPVIVRERMEKHME